MSAALEFLKRLYPSGPYLLTAIALDRKSIETQRFGPATEADCETWIAERDGKRNIYFALNPPVDGARKKTSKEQVKAVHYLHVDIDYRAGEPLADEKARILGLLTEGLPAGVPKPTAVWASGGGFWCVWKLDAPIPINGDVAIAEDVEQHNRWLEYELSGDNCHDISRIARLPGTTNLPDAKKVAKGRAPALAELVYFDESLVYARDAFGRAADPGTDQQGEIAPGPRGKKRGGGGKAKTGEKRATELEDDGDERRDVAEIPADGDVQRLGDISDLDVYESLPERIRVAIVQGSDPDHPKDGDNSRSAWLFDCVCALMRAEVPDELIYSVITDPRFLISESVLALGRNARKYALKQLKSAHHATWDFTRDDKGRVMAGQYNISKALTRLGISVAWNEHACRFEVEGLPGFGPALSDGAMTRMRLLLEKRYKFLPQKEYFAEVATDIGRYNSFEPVREYLRGLQWDGAKRIDTWLIEYAGAPDNAYTRAVSSLWMMAAAKRAFYPGFKFDFMLVLESAIQGWSKSRALAAFCPEAEWFTDSLPLNVNGKEAIEYLRGKWIVECAELNGIRRQQVEPLKAFLARQVDAGRLAYDKNTSEVPRRCVFAGTTNESKYLQDQSGNRRFWPVRLGKPFDVARLLRERDQLWAEAYTRMDRGEPIELDPSLWAVAGEEQHDRVEQHPWAANFSDALRDIKNARVWTEDLWRIVDKDKGQRTLSDKKVFRECLEAMGWKYGKTQRFPLPVAHGDARPKTIKRDCWQIGDGKKALVWADLGVEEEVAPF